MGHSVKWLAVALSGIGFTATILRGQADLAPGDTLRAVLASGQSRDYRLQLRAGEYARVEVEQRSVDVTVTGLGPGGNEIFSIDSNVIGDPETIELIADITGSYLLRITSQPHSPEASTRSRFAKFNPPPSGNGLASQLLWRSPRQWMRGVLARVMGFGKRSATPKKRCGNGEPPRTEARRQNHYSRSGSSTSKSRTGRMLCAIPPRLSRSRIHTRPKGHRTYAGGHWQGS